MDCFSRQLRRDRSYLASKVYDEFDPAMRDKRVISIHKTRETAEKALNTRQHRLGKRVWDCHTRIVWVYNPVHKGDIVTPDVFDTWAPGEKIPWGDRVPDGD